MKTSTFYYTKFCVQALACFIGLAIISVEVKTSINKICLPQSNDPNGTKIGAF